MIEEVGRRLGASLERAKTLYPLTDREQAVVQPLLRGWTNKQIANELGIAEQTVKEHIMPLMQQTNASTRTGILAQDADHEAVREQPALPSPSPVIPLSKPPLRRR